MLLLVRLLATAADSANQVGHPVLLWDFESRWTALETIGSIAVFAGPSFASPDVADLPGVDSAQAAVLAVVAEAVQYEPAYRWLEQVLNSDVSASRHRAPVPRPRLAGAIRLRRGQVPPQRRRQPLGRHGVLPGSTQPVQTAGSRTGELPARCGSDLFARRPSAWCGTNGYSSNATTGASSSGERGFEISKNSRTAMPRPAYRSISLRS